MSERKRMSADESMERWYKVFKATASVAMGAGTFTIGTIILGGIADIKGRQAEKEIASSKGAYEEFTSIKGPVRIVYEGQKEPKCTGDIEKVVAHKNAMGEFTRLHVICKPGEGSYVK